jgi:hypothetical protein
MADLSITLATAPRQEPAAITGPIITAPPLVTK